MLKTLKAIPYILFLLASIDVAQGMAKGPIFKNISPKEALALINKNKGNEDFVILDVRTPREVSSGHIEGAINIDYYSKTFIDELNKLDRGKRYLIYCRSGHRSGKTLKIMEKLGFREVYNMLGGIKAWKKEGLPITYPHRSD